MTCCAWAPGTDREAVAARRGLGVAAAAPAPAATLANPAGLTARALDVPAVLGEGLRDADAPAGLASSGAVAAGGHPSWPQPAGSSPDA